MKKHSIRKRSNSLSYVNRWSVFRMLQDHQLSRKLAGHASAYPPMDTAVEFAKAAFDAGNELAALDTRFFSAGISDVPDWAELSIDPGAARHLGIADGKNSTAIAFVKS